MTLLNARVMHVQPCRYTMGSISVTLAFNHVTVAIRGHVNCRQATLCRRHASDHDDNMSRKYRRICVCNYCLYLGSLVFCSDCVLSSPHKNLFVEIFFGIEGGCQSTEGTALLSTTFDQKLVNVRLTVQTRQYKCELNTPNVKAEQNQTKHLQCSFKRCQEAPFHSWVSARESYKQNALSLEVSK